MYINTNVVRALLSLRRIDGSTLANIANVWPLALDQWLSASADNSEELIPFETQLEILRVLGVHGEIPRNDMVHYWFVHEPLFSRSSRNFWALEALTEAFGPAEVFFFTPETDPFSATEAKAVFGLQFSSFKAVLEVSAHPLRNHGFDPSKVAGTQWASGNAGVLVSQDYFEQIAPGRMTPTLFESQLNASKEASAWLRLNTLAKDNKIGADQLELLLLSAQRNLTTMPRDAVTSSLPAEPLVAEKVISPDSPGHARPAGLAARAPAYSRVREQPGNTAQGRTSPSAANDAAILKQTASLVHPQQGLDDARKETPAAVRAASVSATEKQRPAAVSYRRNLTRRTSTHSSVAKVAPLARTAFGIAE
jgi:hypothetical protein